MSKAIWITARSQFIPVEEMTDEHISNAIEWCKIRIANIDRHTSHTDTPAIAEAKRCERLRVETLLEDLRAEQKERADKKAKKLLYTCTLAPNVPLQVNGEFVPQGATRTFHMYEGDLPVTIGTVKDPVAAVKSMSLKERIDTCTGADLDAAGKELTQFGYGSDWAYARDDYGRDMGDDEYRDLLQSGNAYRKGVLLGIYHK